MGDRLDDERATVGEPLTRQQDADPVEIATKAVRGLRYEDLKPTRRIPHAEDVVIAETVVNALHTAGWRLVRLTQFDTEIVDGDLVPCFVIAEEWTPVYRCADAHHAASTERSEAP